MSDGGSTGDSERREEHFLCETCGQRFAWGGTCPHCDETLVDTDEVPEWQRTSKRRSRELERAGSVLILVLFALPYIAMLALARMNAPASGEPPHWPLWLMLLVYAVLLAIAAPLMRAIATRQRLRTAARRRDALELTPIASVHSSGPVRIRGASRAVRYAHNPEREPCLAYEQVKPESAWEMPSIVRTNGGEFEIDDGSGAIALVRAEHLHVVGGALRDGQLVIPVGATVEVIGEGHWEVASSDNARANSRAAARVLRVEGDEARPVLLIARANDTAPTETASKRSTIRSQSASNESTPTGVRVDGKSGAPSDATSSAEGDGAQRSADTARGGAD
ncbi:MAG: hypothetical protein U0269_22970 [Polyangiales bacterium]